MVEISAASILAMRSSILQQNSALRDAAASGINPAAGGIDSLGKAGASVPGVQGPQSGDSTDFVGAMRNALQQVNALQSEASQAANAYERGETTDIAAVMMAKQKASLGFETTLQVRNKLLSAYKDIMSMPV